MYKNHGEKEKIHPVKSPLKRGAKQFNGVNLLT